MRKSKRSLQALFGAIDQAISGPAAPVETHGQLRRRLLERIAHDAALGTPFTVRPDEGEWNACGEGLEMRVLHRSETTQSYLLRLAPGAVLPAHDHPMDEECLVLEGEVMLEGVATPAGAYHLAPAGAHHQPITTRTGALLFLRGAVPRAEHFRV